jgi:hypothetical protein
MPTNLLRTTGRLDLQSRTTKRYFTAPREDPPFDGKILSRQGVDYKEATADYFLFRVGPETRRKRCFPSVGHHEKK